MKVNLPFGRPRLPMLRTPAKRQGTGCQSPAPQGFSGHPAAGVPEAAGRGRRRGGMIRGICGTGLAALRHGGFAMQRKGQEE